MKISGANENQCAWEIQTLPSDSQTEASGFPSEANAVNWVSCSGSKANSLAGGSSCGQGVARMGTTQMELPKIFEGTMSPKRWRRTRLMTLRDRQSLKISKKIKNTDAETNKNNTQKTTRGKKQKNNKKRTKKEQNAARDTSGADQASKMCKNTRRGRPGIQNVQKHEETNKQKTNKKQKNNKKRTNEQQNAARDTSGADQASLFPFFCACVLFVFCFVSVCFLFFLFCFFFPPGCFFVLFCFSVCIFGLYCFLFFVCFLYLFCTSQ